VRLGVDHVQMQLDLAPVGTRRIQGVPSSPLQLRSFRWTAGVYHDGHTPPPPLRRPLPFSELEQYPVRLPNRFVVLY
jgi:hypothetical protein